jgi:hypothetical protein
VIKTRKKHSKKWKGLLNKVCFVNENFTRTPPKLEHSIKPVALRWKKSSATHPQLGHAFLCNCSFHFRYVSARLPIQVVTI